MLSRGRILVVEDALITRSLCIAALEAAGFRCDGAAGIREAQTAIEGAEYDAIVLDLALPDGRGEDLLGAVAAPVLVISAHRDRIESVRGRVFASILKPCNAADLLLYVDAAVRQRPVPC